MDIKNDENLIRSALGEINDIEPSPDFEPKVFRRITGGSLSRVHTYGWRIVPVPVTVVLLAGIAIMAGSFMNVYAKKLKSCGAAKMTAELARDTFAISPLAVKRYCGNVFSKGVGAVLGPANITCFMENCGKMAKDCAKKCDEKGAACYHTEG